VLGKKEECEAAAHGLQYLFAYIFPLCSDHALGLHVREPLAAKHVIRVCSAGENDRVADAARRLLENAPLIRQSVDLSGAHPLLGKGHIAATAPPLGRLQ